MSPSTASQNKAVVRRLYDEFVNEGDTEAFYEIVAEDVVEHEEAPGLSPDREGVRQFFDMMRQAFPDLRFVVEDMIAEEDRVASRIRMQGTHRGAFMGTEATNSRVDVKVIDFFRLADGKVKEHWGVSDMLSMMQQIDAGPG